MILNLDVFTKNYLHETQPKHLGVDTKNVF